MVRRSPTRGVGWAKHQSWTICAPSHCEFCGRKPLVIGVLHARLQAAESGLRAGSALYRLSSRVVARSRLTLVPTTMLSPYAWSARLEGKGEC